MSNNITKEYLRERLRMMRTSLHENGIMKTELVFIMEILEYLTDEKCWVCVGTKRLSGPWSSQEMAIKWAEAELPRGETYYIEREEDVF